MASCWIEVDLNAVRENYRALHALLGPDIDIIAVVKADAYGLGALETSRVLAEEGARLSRCHARRRSAGFATGRN